LTGNALENLPSDGTLFFLFNPFAREVVDRFRVRLDTRVGGVRMSG
jgi:hypothetical protein